MKTEGGFAWAEPEMVYEEAENTLTTATNMKEALEQYERQRGQAGPASVKLATRGGARVDMVLSRELRAAINAGLSAAWAQTVRESVRPWAFKTHAWFVPSLRS